MIRRPEILKFWKLTTIDGCKRKCKKIFRPSNTFHSFSSFLFFDLFYSFLNLYLQLVSLIKTLELESNLTRRLIKVYYYLLNFAKLPKKETSDFVCVQMKQRSMLVSMMFT